MSDIELLFIVVIGYVTGWLHCEFDWRRYVENKEAE